MAKVRKCISIDRDIVNYIDQITEKADKSFSYIVNYYPKEFVKFHREALASGES